MATQDGQAPQVEAQQPIIVSNGLDTCGQLWQKYHTHFVFLLLFLLFVTGFVIGFVVRVVTHK